MAIYRDLSIRETTDSVFTLFSASSVDLASSIQRDRDTHVFADEIIVSGEVDVGTHHVRLVCRKLVFLSNSKLMANGAAAPPHAKSKADPMVQAGRHANGNGINGQNGNDGAAGVAGDPGGFIEVWAGEIAGKSHFTCNGGDASRPQHGGDGQMGGNGIPGTRDVGTRSKGIPPTANGGAAGRGGDAGLPGERVLGGAPGRILVKTLATSLAPSAVLEARSGEPSPLAEGGEPGNPGIPGAAGTWFRYYCYDKVPPSIMQLDAKLNSIGPHREVCNVADRGWGHAGASSVPGSHRDAEVRARQETVPAPVVGTTLLETAIDADFGGQLDSTFVELALEAIENTYALHGTDPNAPWLAQHAFLLPLLIAAAPQRQELSEAAVRLEALGAKIGVGLDFFGYSRTHTVLLSYETYSEIIDRTLLPALRTVDALWQRYRDADENSQAQYSELNESVAQASERIVRIDSHTASLREHLSSMVESRPDQPGELILLDRKVAACEAVLLEAEQDLTEAIKRQHKGCDLMGTLRAAAMIYAGVASGGVGLIGAARGTADLIGHLNKEAGSWDQFYKNVFALKGPLEEIAKHANSVAEGISKIQQGLAALDPKEPRVPHFSIERAQFDQIAKDFAQLAEAADYRLAGHAYLDAITARNEAIIRYNALLTQLVEALEARAALVRMISIARSALGRHTDPGAPAIIIGMRRLLRETLVMTGRMIHAERKALNYLFARDADVSIPMLNLATLNAAHARAREDWVTAKSRHDARIRREISPHAIALRMSSLVQPVAFEAFKRTGVLNFSIRIDHPHYGAILRHLPGLRVSGISLLFNGASMNPAAPQQIPWRLIHHGHQVVYRQSGESFHYSHQPLVFSGLSDPAGTAPPGIHPEVTEGGIYAGASPFASWLLEVNIADEHLAVDLSVLDELTMHLSGYMLEG